MTLVLAKIAKSCQADFAKPSMADFADRNTNQPMRQARRSEKKPMPHLRRWREALRLSRPEVVNRLSMLPEVSQPIDQATLAKWETGESAVRVEDIELLAKIYGVTADRLFFPPADTLTPQLLGEAHRIITGKDPEAVKAWLASGKFLPESKK
jgi:transcriptional regulator with XRE-family HTH domain